MNLQFSTQSTVVGGEQNEDRGIWSKTLQTLIHSFNLINFQDFI